MEIIFLRSFDGQVSWDKDIAIGYSYQADDETITHHIVDRPAVSNQYLSR
jgi:pescadillo protein